MSLVLTHQSHVFPVIMPVRTHESGQQDIFRLNWNLPIPLGHVQFCHEFCAPEFIMHIRDLRRIHPILDLKTASTVATSIVHMKLDYCNSVSLNIDITQINRLQATQNALARVVTKTLKHHKKLHWLKIPKRIEYKAISLT